MSQLGYLALIFAAGCLVAVLHDLWVHQTAFAQFSAARSRQPIIYWFGISGWLACIMACLLVAAKDHVRTICGDEEPCTVDMMIEAPAQ